MSRPLNLLMVEDSASDAALLLRALETEGYRPRSRIVEDPAGLQGALAAEEWDLVVSDYAMPAFDGLAALKLVQASGRDLPFIIVSGAIGEEVAVAAMKAGAHDYLMKGNLARLGAAVERALEQKRLRQEKRAAQQALLDSEELFRRLNECSPIGMLLLDNQGHCSYCNPRGRQILGTTLGGTVGLGWTRAIPPSDRESVIKDWLAALRTEREFAGVFRLQTAPRAVRWLRARSSPISAAADRGQGHVATIEDVTEHTQLEEQFLEAQKMEVVGKLAGGVAHDFNNILAVVLGYSDIIAQKLPPADPNQKHLDQIRHAAQRAAGLTRQLLAFSRRQTVQLVVLDLNEVLAGMETMLRRLLDERVGLTVVPGERLGRIKADSGYLGQVLMNLVVNARDAMPDGGQLTITTSNVTLADTDGRLHPGLPAGDQVLLSVRDTGTGMTAEVQAHLFEAFFTTKPKGQGTGLGLATCQTIVQQSGGQITFESEVGKGTVFHVYFPRVAQPLAAAAPPAPVQAPPRGTETLMLVEDEPAVRHLAADVLEERGYTVLRASNGQDGLRVAREHKGEPIRLVVTDVIMPQMGGQVMAEWLQSSYPDLKILFTSGYTDDALAQQGGLQAGVAWLPKPYTPETLARKVRQILDAPPVANS